MFLFLHRLLLNLFIFHFERLALHFLFTFRTFSMDARNLSSIGNARCRAGSRIRHTHHCIRHSIRLLLKLISSAADL